MTSPSRSIIFRDTNPSMELIDSMDLVSNSSQPSSSLSFDFFSNTVPPNLNQSASFSLEDRLVTRFESPIPSSINQSKEEEAFDFHEMSQSLNYDSSDEEMINASMLLEESESSLDLTSISKALTEQHYDLETATGIAHSILDDRKRSIALRYISKILMEQYCYFNSAIDIAHTIPDQEIKSWALGDTCKYIVDLYRRFNIGIKHFELIVKTAKSIPDTQRRSGSAEYICRALIHEDTIRNIILMRITSFSLAEIPLLIDDLNRRNIVLRDLSMALTDFRWSPSEDPNTLLLATNIAYMINDDEMQSTVLWYICGTFIEYFDFNQAISIANSISDASIMSYALADICNALIKDDNVDRTRDAPFSTTHKRKRSLNFQDTPGVVTPAFDVEKAVYVAHLIPDKNIKSLVFRNISEALLKNNDVKGATGVAHLIPDDDKRESALKYIRTMQTPEPVAKRLKADPKINEDLDYDLH